jgi:hypothetical protein
LSSNDTYAAPKDLYEDLCRQRGLRWPTGLSAQLTGAAGVALRELIYWPDGEPTSLNSLSYGLALLSEAVYRAPDNLLPLLPVDDRSIACIVCVPQAEWDDEDSEAGSAPSEVIRWHLDAIPEAEQGALLDIDAGLYLETVAQELRDRPYAMERILREADRYQEQYISNDRLPRSHVRRPVQLACQNVIIGLACVEQDSRIDSIRVRDYVTCEVPHLATHEANRALTALLLCDAFRNGGTMEVRFGASGRDQPIPPPLRRFGRTLGLDLGHVDKCAITPDEARSLFLAVTPMPETLAGRCSTLLDRGLIAPERLCYTLMSGTWMNIELDYVLGTSSRSASILSGGGDSAHRRERLVESETCRAAIMVGTLYKRLVSVDKAAGDAKGVRVFEQKKELSRFTAALVKFHGGRIHQPLISRSDRL